MPHVNTLITSEYYQYIQNMDFTVPLVSPIDNRNGTVKITPTIYSLDDKSTHGAVPATDKTTRISTAVYKSNNAFLRITNKADFIPKSDVALCIPTEHYHYAQEFGMTLNTDQALTAKLIGHIGNYRFRVLKDQEQYLQRTNLFHVKEEICQYAFARLNALKIVESTFGLPKEKVIEALNKYKLRIHELLAQVASEAFSKSAHDVTPKDSTTTWQKIYDTLNHSACTPSQLQILLNNCRDPNQKRALRHCLSLYGDIQKAGELMNEVSELPDDLPSHPVYGVDETKFPVEKMVRAIAEDVITEATTSNDLATLVDSNSLFTGVLKEHLGKAAVQCTNYTFNQQKLIEPEHQGQYTIGDHITLSSTHTVGEGREDTRRFLLFSSYMLHLVNSDDDPMYDEDPRFTVTTTRGWARLFRTERGRGIFHTYEHLRNLTAKASISRFRTAFEDLRDLGDVLTEGVSKAIRGITSAFGHEFYQLYDDAVLQQPEASTDTQSKKVYPDGTEHDVEMATLGDNYSIMTDAPDSPVFREGPLQLNTTAAPTDEKSVAKHGSELSEMEFNLVIDENWHRWTQKRKLQYIVDTVVKKHNAKDFPLSEQQKRNLDMLRNTINVLIESAPLALPPSELGHTDPDDLLSSIVGGVETFYTVFDEIYEINPGISLCCSLLYIISGLAATNPDLAAAIMAKINLNALTQPLIYLSTETAHVMTQGQMSNFISAGFTAWQEFFLVSKALSQAGDSIAGDLCRYVNHHLPKMIGGVLAAAALGKFVTSDYAAKIPGINQLGSYIREDAGSLPVIEEFFAGVKLGTIAYEALQSKPQGQSLASNSVSFLLKVALFIPRIVISAYNFIRACFDKNPTTSSLRMQKAARPWVEIGQGIKSGFLRISDASLRILNIGGAAFKRVCKTITSTVLNLATILTKIITRPFLHKESNWVAGALVNFKYGVFAACNKPATWLKNAYRWCRNGIARALRTDEQIAVPPPRQLVVNSPSSARGLSTPASLLSRGMGVGTAATDNLAIEALPTSPDSPLTRLVSDASVVAADEKYVTSRRQASA